MALDNRPLTALGASEQAASLASLPEDLWRKIASLARPPTVRALVVACSDASLRSALRTDIDRAERAAFGLTQREAERSLLVGGASLKPEICEIVKEIAVAKNTFAMGGA